MPTPSNPDAAGPRRVALRPATGTAAVLCHAADILDLIAGGTWEPDPRLLAALADLLRQGAGRVETRAHHAAG